MVKTIGFIGRFTRKHYLCRYNNLRNVKFWRFDNLRNVKFRRYNNLRNVKIDQRTQVWKERSMTNFLHGRIPARGQVPFWLKVLHDGDISIKDGITYLYIWQNYYSLISHRSHGSHRFLSHRLYWIQFYVDDYFILLKCLENKFSEALPENKTSILLECSCPVQDVINIKRIQSQSVEINLWDLWDPCDI